MKKREEDLGINEQEEKYSLYLINLRFCHFSDSLLNFLASVLVSRSLFLSLFPSLSHTPSISHLFPFSIFISDFVPI